MQNTSQYYKNAISGRTVEYNWFGTILFSDSTGISFDKDCLDQSKSKITRQCVTGKNLEIGNVYTAELKLSLRDNENFQISSKMFNYQDAEIFVFFSAGGWDVKCGIFTVTDVERTYHTVTLTAYDNGQKFNGKTTSIFSGTYTPYNAISAICTACGVTLATTQADIEALPNGDRTDLKMSVYKKGATYKSILGNICMLLGSNAVINEDGYLVIFKYGRENQRAISASERYSSSYADFIGRYTSFFYTNKNGDVKEYTRTPASSPYRNLSMNLGKNTLLNAYNSTKRDIVLEEVAAYLYYIIYSPCTITMPADPSIDVGDMVSIIGGEISGSYTKSLDTSVVQGKTYYALIGETYTVVTPVGNENPSEEGWYEVGISILCTKMEIPFFGQMKITSEAGSYSVEIDSHATKKEQEEQEKEQDQDEKNKETDSNLNDIRNELSNITALASVFYVFPYYVISESIGDGVTAYIEKFQFSCETEGDAASFYSMISFEVETTVDNDTYNDCNVTVTYYLDGSLIKTATHTYGDGNAILTLNGCLTGLATGDHTFDVMFTVSGGSLS